MKEKMLKQFSANSNSSTRKYIDILDQFVEYYSNTSHHHCNFLTRLLHQNSILLLVFAYFCILYIFCTLFVGLRFVMPLIQYKKAVLSQRCPRDARYISRSWAVAEIWRFVRIENNAIRSAVPENPTLEQNMKWIGRPVAELWTFEIFPRWRRAPSWICSNQK